MEPIEHLRKAIERDVETAKADLKSFTDKLASDPVYALEWSQRSFEVQAKGAIASAVLEWLSEPEFTLDKLRKKAISEAQRAALYPSFSTSPTTNLMHQYKGAAWAAMAERIAYL